MSKQTKKPAEVTAKKVKNINLLPQVFATEPNKKMLDSTLDLMTSKGQLLNFKETIGLRSATNGVNEFFTVEKDDGEFLCKPIRRYSVTLLFGIIPGKLGVNVNNEPELLASDA